MTDLIGALWGRQYTLVAEDGSRIVLTGQDEGVNISTPESTVGWDLAHVRQGPTPDTIYVAGKLFRSVPG